VIYYYNESQRDALISQIYLIKYLHFSDKSDQRRIKENGSNAFANFKFVRLFRTILIIKANEMH